MKISGINSFQNTFKGASDDTKSEVSYENQVKTNKKDKTSFLDKFETEVKNSADMNDTLQVPRTIFKGYLAFCAGSALMPVAAMIKNKHPKISNALNFTNAGLVIYGTYSFVRPYLINTEKSKK